MIFLISSAMAGCTSTHYRSSTDSEKLPGFFLSKKYVEQYGRVESNEIASYIELIISRLGLSSLKSKVIILASEKPIAFTPGGEYILLSKGLLRVLDNEAEFAFVLAHELGHLQYAHHQRAKEGDNGDERRELEFEADIFALKALKISGYALSAGPSAIKGVHLSAEGDLACYGDAFKRSERLSKGLGALGPGALNTRAYKRFISFLP